MSTVNIFSTPSAFTEDAGILLQWAKYWPTQIVWLQAGEALEVGECVALDFTTIAGLITSIPKTEAEAAAVGAALPKVLKTASVTAGAKGFIGVTMQTVASGAALPVCVGGFCPFVQTGGSVAAGDNLTCAAGAGKLITYAAGTHTGMSVVGYALDADADIGSNPDEIGCSAWLFPTWPI